MVDCCDKNGSWLPGIVEMKKTSMPTPRAPLICNYTYYSNWLRGEISAPRYRGTYRMICITDFNWIVDDSFSYSSFSSLSSPLFSTAILVRFVIILADFLPTFLLPTHSPHHFNSPYYHPPRYSLYALKYVFLPLLPPFYFLHLPSSPSHFNSEILPTRIASLVAVKMILPCVPLDSVGFALGKMQELCEFKTSLGFVSSCYDIFFLFLIFVDRDDMMIILWPNISSDIYTVNMQF